MDQAAIYKAIGGRVKVSEHWMPVTGGLRAFVYEDPFLVWAKLHGESYGYSADEPKYSMLTFIAEHGNAFERKWISEVAKGAVYAMQEDREVRYVGSFLRTVELMRQRVPIIAHASLWAAHSSYYGACDVLMLMSKFRELFGDCSPDDSTSKNGTVEASKEKDYYIIIDCKLTTKITSPAHKRDLECYRQQLSLYTYALARIQGHTPQYAYLVTRDCPLRPLPVAVCADHTQPLGEELATLRDRYIQIKHDKKLLPWNTDWLAPNVHNAKDEPYHGAKKAVLSDHMADRRSLSLLPRVGKTQEAKLQELGYTTLDDLLAVEPDSIDFDQVGGLKSKSIKPIKAMLAATRNGKVIVPKSVQVPNPTKCFYVDYEFFNNSNIDWKHENWDECCGIEMVFKIGMSWLQDGILRHQQWTAEHESHAAEKKMFEEWIEFLDKHGALEGSAKLVHWTSAEVWQARRASDRLGLPKLKTHLHWHDLQKDWKKGFAVPNCFDNGLKSVVSGISAVSSELAISWPDDLSAGQVAQVMGWIAYRQQRPLETTEMKLIGDYLEVDCKALWVVHRFMLESISGSSGDDGLEARPIWQVKTAAHESSTLQNEPSRAALWFAKSMVWPSRRCSGVGWYRSWNSSAASWKLL